MLEDWLNHDAVALWGPAPGRYGEVTRGKVIGVQSAPTIIIETLSGEHLHWAASLCRLVATWEEVQHLREALLLEGADVPS